MVFKTTSNLNTKLSLFKDIAFLVFSYITLLELTIKAIIPFIPASYIMYDSILQQGHNVHNHQRFCHQFSFQYIHVIYNSVLTCYSIWINCRTIFRIYWSHQMHKTRIFSTSSDYTAQIYKRIIKFEAISKF